MERQGREVLESALGGLLRGLRAVEAHRDADVGLRQRWTVVDTIAGHCCACTHGPHSHNPMPKSRVNWWRLHNCAGTAAWLQKNRRWRRNIACFIEQAVPPPSSAGWWSLKRVSTIFLF